MADINVLVVVDTTNITQQNLNSTVTLVDDNLDTDDTSNDSTTFDIKIPKGVSKTIQFRIIAVDESTEVNFNVDSDSLKPFVQEGALFTSLPTSANSYVGTAEGNTGGTTDKFTINFKVGSTQYSLDPVLQVNT